MRAAAPRLIVLAVKPQVILAVAGDYRRFAEGGTTFLSIAAGTPMAALENVLGAVPLVRCMPNTPAAIGKGMMVTVDNGRVAAPDAAFIDALRDALPPEIPFEEVDAHVDDPEFADLVAERYLTLAKETADVI